MARPPWRPSCSPRALRTRAELLRTARTFFAERDVLEVQTPVVGSHTVTDPAIESMELAPPPPGGAASAPRRFLQTSPEYHMKRLLAAGAPSIYAVAPAFRAGERGAWHNPEFTLVEWYRLGYDDRQLMTEVAELVNALLGPAEYVRRDYAELVASVGAGDSGTELAQARRLGLRGGDGGDASDADDAADFLLARAIATLDAERVFVTGYPARQAALARLRPNGTAARFELVVNGLEIANGYHELADADELRQRMATDGERRRRRGQRTVTADPLLLAAHRRGLPDCAGVALGFDRVVALKLGAKSVAETLTFDWERA